MKKSIVFIILAIVTLSTAHSQGFDYEETSFEIGVDIIPIFGGDNPYSLFLRKNYQTSTGKNRAWRASISANNTNLFSEFPINGNFDRAAYHNAGFMIGKEYQKIVTDRILVYSGMDLGFNINSRKYSYAEPTFADLAITQIKSHSFIYSATLFSGVKYHLTPRFSVFAETGIEAAYVRSSSIINWGTSNLEVRKDRSLDLEQLKYNIIPLRSVRIAYHF